MTAVTLPATKGFPGWVWPTLMTLIVFGCTFFLGTRHHDFPYFYHTDEPSKAEQLISGERNFFHPALMLNATAAASRLFGVPHEKQSMVVTGRTVSALFAALAITGFSLVAWRLGGLGAGVLAGVFCLLSADFYDAAHYMKEDPYWVSGLSFTFLAALQYWKKPTTAFAILLGLAAGWSVAGKYIGFISLLIALLTIVGKMIASKLRNFIPLLLCLVSAAFIFLTINYQILSEPKTMTAGLGKEVSSLYNEHHQKNDKFKLTRYVDLLTDTVPAVAIVLAGGFLIFGLGKWKCTPLPELLFLLLPIILFVALTYTPKGSARYFLPIGLMLLTSAAIAVALVVHYFQSKPKPWQLASWVFAVLAVVAVVIPLNKEYKSRRHAFANDYRKTLADYIRKNVPADALIAADQRAAMPSADDPRYAGFTNLLPNKILITRYTADLGTLDELLARGVSYVVVASRDANRLGNDDNFSNQDHKKLPARRRFYQDLSQRGLIEWQSKLGDNKYLNVSLILYRIGPKVL